MKSKISQAQHYLRERKLDGWLLYDFHRNNPLAHRFLEIPAGAMATRRFFYWIPTHGEPIALLHAIEPHTLAHCPGERRRYLSWQSLHRELKGLLGKSRRVAMEYSPQNQIPYISCVDGGTLELVRSFGVEVVSSAPFLPHFTATLTEGQIESQKRAAKGLLEIVAGAWHWIGEELKKGRGVVEADVQRYLLREFERCSLVTESPPIVAVGPHSADPHYSPPAEGSSPLRKGELVLIDLWAKERGEGAVYGDLTQVGLLGVEATPKQRRVFETVSRAQKGAIECVRGRLSEGREVLGWEVDRAARSIVEEAGYGEQFIHRTGHSIEVELHGSGAHLDDLEMHDTRPLLPATCFSVEPGIYLPGEFGVRLETDVIIHPDGTLEVTGGLQSDFIQVL